MPNVFDQFDQPSPATGPTVPGAMGPSITVEPPSPLVKQTKVANVGQTLTSTAKTAQDISLTAAKAPAEIAKGQTEADTGALALRQKQVGAQSSADAIKQLEAQVAAKRALAEGAQRFMVRQKQGDQTATGPGMAIKIPLINKTVADLASYDPNTGASLQNLDAINAENWTNFRPAQSGPIRAYEATSWKNAFPSTTNYGTTNAEISQRLQNEYQQLAKFTAFANDFVAKGKGDLAAAALAFGDPNIKPPSASPANAQAANAPMPKSGEPGAIVYGKGGKRGMWNQTGTAIIPLD